MGAQDFSFAAYIAGAASRPIAGKPAPTGTAQSFSMALPLWEPACRRWAAQQTQQHQAPRQRCSTYWPLKVTAGSSLPALLTVVSSVNRALPRRWYMVKNRSQVFSSGAAQRATAAPVTGSG
ncbi:hypothetical protein D3C79_843950 [compost metagenome]